MAELHQRRNLEVNDELDRLIAEMNRIPVDGDQHDGLLGYIIITVKNNREQQYTVHCTHGDEKLMRETMQQVLDLLNIERALNRG